MPLYEYHCNDCDEAFEKLVSFAEANRNPVCPSCQGLNTHKKISRIAALAGSASASSASAASAATASTSSCGSGGRFR